MSATRSDLEGLRSRFIPQLVEHARSRGVISGNATKGWTVRKTVAPGVQMIYVIRSRLARVEMWIYQGSSDDEVESAGDLFDQFTAKKQEIEHAYGGSLNWSHRGRKTAFSIQQDYLDFDLRQEDRWEEWIERMVSDMQRLDAALLPHYRSTR